MPIDAAKQAEGLAQIFFNLSDAVDDFWQRNYADLSADQAREFKVQAQALASQGQRCSAQALAAILQDIQPHLADIKQAAQDAQNALARLNDIAKAAAIVDSAVALGHSVCTGDLGSIANNVQGLCQAVHG
jgi:hypothetical protein